MFIGISLFFFLLAIPLLVVSLPRANLGDSSVSIDQNTRPHRGVVRVFVVLEFDIISCGAVSILIFLTLWVVTWFAVFQYHPTK